MNNNITICFGTEIANFYQSKRYAECLSTIEEFFIYTPPTNILTTIRIRIIQANSWTMLGINKNKVFENLSQVIALDPKNSAAHYALGLAEYREGNFVSCIQSFETAFDLNPSGSMQMAMAYRANAIILMNLLNDADNQFEMQNFDRAFEILDAALLIDPQNDKISEFIRRIGDFFSSSMQEDSNNESADVYDEIEILITECKLVEAEALFDEICDQHPKNSEAFYLKGLVANMKGCLVEAQSLFESALCLDRSNEKAQHMNLKVKTLKMLLDTAVNAIKEDCNDEAVEAFTNAIALDVNNPVIHHGAHLLRGMAYFNLGIFEKSREDFEMFEVQKEMVRCSLGAFDSPMLS